MKKFPHLLFALLVIFLFSVPATAEETQDIKVYVNDTRVEFDVPPIFVQDRTMVPIRAVFEALGANVDWNGNTRTVTVTRGKYRIQVQLDNRNAFVNGKSVTMEVPAMGTNGRILVPLRFFGEHLGLNVDWSNSTKTAFISDPSLTDNKGNIQNWGKFATDGEWNYYILQNNILIRENISTKRQEKISEHIICDLHIYKNWIYCVGLTKGTPGVVRMNKDGSGKKVVIDGPVHSMQIVNDWIYYGDPQNETVLYRTGTDGSNTKEILHDGDFSPKNWLVQDGWIFYFNLISQAITRARIDGSDPIQMAEIKTVSGTRTGESSGQNTEPACELKLIDKEYLYFTLDNKAYVGSSQMEPGLYRLSLASGKAHRITGSLPLAVNMDDTWIYMAVAGNVNPYFIRIGKDGSNELLINEYKENDVPRYIYLDESYIYYSLLRGNNKLELFKMNLRGENISQITWRYGSNTSQLKKLLSETESAYASLKNFTSVLMSELNADSRKSIYNDRKINLSDSMVYQSIKDEQEQDLEIWIRSIYAYSRKSGDKHWNILQLDKAPNVRENTVFSYISPTDELCNDLSIKQETDEAIILSGTGSFPDFMRSAAASGELAFNKSTDFFDTVSIEIVISKKTKLVEGLTLKLIFYPEKPAGNKKQYESSYSYTNSRFNSTLFYIPVSLEQSLSAKTQADYKIHQSYALIQDGKYQNAIELLDAAIGIYNMAYNAYLYKGDALYHLGKYREAILAYDQYRELNPSDLEVLSLEGLCYLKLGEIGKAEQLAKLVIDDNENNVTALNLMGSIAAAKEDYSNALGFYEKAVQLDNRHYESHLNLATVLFDMGSYTKCIRTVDEYLLRFSQDRDLLYLKAQSLSRKGKYTEAIEVFEQILSKNPSNDFVTMTYIALEYENLQNFKKAEEYANKAKAIYSDYSLLNSLLERLVYERSTSSSQKLVDFIKDNYLYYRENDEVFKAFSDITAKMNGYSIDDVKNLIKILKGSQDNSTYVLSGADFDAYMNRQMSSVMETRQEGDTVYVSIKTFSQEIGIQFAEFIQNIEHSEEKALILDLRGNSGGLSSEANIMLDALLPECTPSYIIERDGYINAYKSGKSYTKFRKIGILVDEKTASSSELLALGLKTYAGNAVIIGKKTMGRGVGQVVYLDRAKEYAIFLVNHYWNVLQENIHDKGLPIDITVGVDDPDYSKAIARFLKD